ncbi:hypothetical protein UFOVP1605_50 [uncultured Caudovirales phage]|uniref:Uncharacterized protein n=1 Tax=uncultured Caudovirales phage TaxID=2100421 RepID=A0A6J5SW10_9CAUD|nr:hypothetical protein UFOVP1605_50 [uncultured Caudovirales phage]
MNHNFTQHSIGKLIYQKGCFMATLTNDAAKHIHDNYRNNIKQIDAELSARGIKSLKQKRT